MNITPVPAGKTIEQLLPTQLAMVATPFRLPSLPSYPGGKGGEGTIRTIINQIPPHRRYFEPFLGGGAVMRHKRPADVNTGWERDELIVDVWKREAPIGINVTCGNALALLRSTTFQASDFLFIDPPYLVETITNPRIYPHMLTQADHLELLDLLGKLPAMVMVCALPNLTYENRLSGWRTIQYQNMTRGGQQTEQLWMNYAEPTALHDTRYIGTDYRERERIRRKAAFLRRKLDALPPLHRQAVLEHLNA